jgi:hypothetical protein
MASVVRGAHVSLVGASALVEGLPGESNPCSDVMRVSLLWRFSRL